MRRAPNIQAATKRVRQRARSRGLVYVEYLIVTGFVFFVVMVTFYKMGPRVVGNFRDAIKVVVEKAP